MRGLFAWAREAQFVRRPTQQPPSNTRSQEERKASLSGRKRTWKLTKLGGRTAPRSAYGWPSCYIRDFGVVTPSGWVGSTCASDRDTSHRKEPRLIEVTIPLLPPLLEALAAGPTGDLRSSAVRAESRSPRKASGTFSGKACKTAGVHKSAHGVRKIGATRAANNGATVAELEAIFGWTGSNMASHYTRAADRSRLARTAIGKLVNSPGTSIPAPDQKVRAAAQKD